MKKILLVLLVGAFAYSCGNDDDNGPVDPSTPSYFYPLTVGNTWNYVEEDSDSSEETGIQISGSRTENGITYYSTIEPTSSAEGDELFYVQGQGSILATGDESIFGGLGDLSEAFLLIDDNLSVGQGWQETIEVEFQGEPVEAQQRNTIEAVLSSFTVGTETFTDVKQVNTVVSVTQSGITLQAAEIDAYWAQGVGLVRIDVEAPLLDQSYSVSITGYTVN